MASSIQVTIEGNVGLDQRLLDEIIAGIREASSNRDIILIDPNSRQAQGLLEPKEILCPCCGMHLIG